jgi:PAS domain S-box-containing protein
MLRIFAPVGSQIGQFIVRRRAEDDLRRSEDALRRSGAQLQSVIDSALDAVITMDSAGIVRAWNARAASIFGWSEAEALGRSLAELIIPPRLRKAHARGLEQFVAGRQGPLLGRRVEMVGVRKDGSELPVELSVTATREGESFVFYGFVADISQRRRGEEERLRLLESERRARAEAERHSRLKDEFLATLSHELRTPLNAILGWAHLIRSGLTRPEDVPRGLEVIERNAKVQARLVEDLLDMSRIVSGKLKLEVRAVDLGGVIRAAIEAVRPAASGKGIQLGAPVGDGTLILADAARLQQVVWNLLANAVKFTPRGGHVDVAVDRPNGHVEITVRDTGEGIRPEFLPFLFERFTQSDSSSTRQHGGLGLGLALVRQFVEAHGGSVHAASAGEGRGASFTVRLPALRSASDSVAGLDGPVQGRLPDAPDLAGIRVLLVDDDVDARVLVSKVLESRGAQVETAASAREGFDLIRKAPPDVLLADIGMPGEDGYAFIQRIRTLGPEQGGDVPAAALTAYASDQDQARALASGFQRHVAKPTDPSDLAWIVAELARR